MKEAFTRPPDASVKPLHNLPNMKRSVLSKSRHLFGALTLATAFCQTSGLPLRLMQQISAKGKLRAVMPTFMNRRVAVLSGLALSAAMAGPARAEAAQMIKVGSLAADQGFALIGDAAGDQFGFSVSSAGDVNGDGIADQIVGAPRGDDGGTNAGEAYVIYGRTGPRDALDFTALSEADGFVIIADSIFGPTPPPATLIGDQAGFSVSGGGDVNGDGIADLIVGAPGGDLGGVNAGEAFVIYGRAGTRGPVVLADLVAADGFAIIGAADDSAGYSVADAGDVNGDGIADVIVGVPFGDRGGKDDGEAYVVYGRSGTRGPLALASLTREEGFVIIGNRFSDAAGARVSGAGDVNGDRISDLLVGAPDGPFDDGDSNDGEVHVIYGRVGTRDPVNLTSVSENEGFRLFGDAQGEFAGFSVTDAGDVNGDGIGDLIVGAARGLDRGADGGEAYVIFGATGLRGPVDLDLLTQFDLSFGFAITGDAAFDFAGSSVSGAGDTNGDGIDDLIVGAPFGDDGGANAGEAYVIYGRTGPRGLVSLTNLAAADGLAIVGAAAGDQLGFSVAGAGDVNGDEIADLIVGAPQGDIGGMEAGEAYVIYGVFADPGNPGVTITGTAGDDIVSARVTPAGQPLPTAADDTVLGLDGNDTLDAGAGNDRYVGGLGNDIYVIDSIGDVVIEDPLGFTGRDTMQSATVDLILAANVEDGTLTDANSLGANLAIAGNVLPNTLTGNSGANTLDGAQGSDTLSGNAGDDMLIGGDGNDTLNGQAGNDTLTGGNTDDVLAGGAGTDLMTGGSGADKFKFDESALDAAIDTIADFSRAQRDIIDLRGIDANGAAPRDGKFAFIGTGAFTARVGQLRYQQSGGATKLLGDINGDGTADIQIHVLGRVSFIASDFVL